jgi:hypothetical protein
MPQYSAVGICAAIVDITSTQCALYCKFGGKYSAHRPFYAVLTEVPDVYNVLTVPHSYASIFTCRHLRWYYRYHINSMRPNTANLMPNTAHILQFPINWTVAPAIYKVFTAPHIWASIFKCRYHRWYCRYHDNWMRVILLLVPNTAHILQFTLCELWSRSYAMHLQLRILDFNIQL